MPKFKLTSEEMIKILDPIGSEPWDELQSALEGKVLEVISEKKWLEIWESGRWNIELTISFDNIKELENA